MKRLYSVGLFLHIIIFISLSIQVKAQGNQCPGCIADASCSISPAYPKLCPSKLPDGKVGQAYNETISFYLPAQFTDPGSGINVTLLEIEILNIANMPYGFNYTSNIYPNKIYYPSSNPPTTEHGCAKICGTPLLTYADSMIVNIRVKVDAGIGGIVTKYMSFYIKVNILPGSSGNTGFTVTNGSGCSPITSSFQTNYPSAGNTAYSYAWDFGNGLTSPVENPPAQIYSVAGNYQVTLKTTIDTLPYVLKSIEVLGSDCTDFWSNPDFYTIVLQGNTEVLNTQKAPYSAVIDKLPPVKLTFNPIRLKNATYKLQIWDEDGGLGGTDDSCGQVSFNGYTAGVFTQAAGALVIKYEITHNKLVFYDTAKITVYPNPSSPLITFAPNDSVCVNDSILLSIPSASSYQWLKDTVQIIKANSQDFKAGINGNYSVKITNQYGCTAKSNVVKLSFIPNPPKPTLWTSNGVFNTNLAGYKLQWFGEGQAISNANKMTYAPVISGNYYLMASNAFGCSTNSDSVFITCPVVPPIVFTPNDTACVNDTIILSGSGGGNYQWYKDSVQISNAASSKYSAIQSGMYEVRVTNNFGCAVKSGGLKLQFSAKPIKPLILINGNSLSSSSAGNTLQWFYHGNPIQGANQQNYTVSKSGYYLVEAQNISACKTKSDSIYINYIGIAENDFIFEDLKIYPNPGNGLINISYTARENASIKIQIIDILGRIILDESANTITGKAIEKKLDLSDNEKGIYLLVIRDGKHQLNRRIIIQ